MENPQERRYYYEAKPHKALELLDEIEKLETKFRELQEKLELEERKNTKLRNNIRLANVYLVDVCVEEVNLGNGGSVSRMHDAAHKARDILLECMDEKESEHV